MLVTTYRKVNKNSKEVLFLGFLFFNLSKQPTKWAWQDTARERLS